MIEESRPDPKWTAMTDYLNFVQERLGQTIPPGSSVLDFGCGTGQQVALLIEHGYDAWGVEVNQLWDQTSETTPVHRLKVVTESDYRLPFPDATFDFCFSEQVMEHVANPTLIFSEIARVLKPTAISIHRFPGPNYLYEGHINLPFPYLCHNRIYLALCAMAGFRRPGEEHLNWRQQLGIYSHIMSDVHYRWKSEWRRHADAAGVAINFVERSEFDFRGGGRMRKILQAARTVGLGKLTVMLAGLIMQRCMTLRPLTRPTAEKLSELTLRDLK